MNEDVIRAIAVTAELTNKTLSLDAASVLATELSSFPAHQVIRSLDRF